MKWKQEDMAGDIEPGGTYAGKVHEAEERTSQAGNPYINLKLHVQGMTFYDIITPRYPPKLAHFCKSAKLEDKYELMALEASDCVGRAVMVILSTEKNEKGYLEIADYTWEGREEKPATKKTGQVEKMEGVPAGQAAKAKAAHPDEDCPF